MGYISEVTIGENTYDIKDAEARELIEALESATDYLGVTTTELEDNVTTSPVVVIAGESVTAVKGNSVNYGSKEFIYNGTVWQEYGDLSGLGDLAGKDEATGTFTPTGSVSAPTVSITGTQTASVEGIDSVGTLPTFTVANETLTITAGTLPTKATAVTAVTNVGSATATAPTFMGTAGTVTVS